MRTVLDDARPAWGEIQERIQLATGLRIEARPDGEQISVQSPSGARFTQTMTGVELAQNPRSPLGMAWNTVRYPLYELVSEGRRRFSFDPCFALNCPHPVDLASDRIVAEALLAEAGVPSLRHLLVRSWEEVERALAEGTIDWPLCAKPIAGYRGRGIFLDLEAPAEARPRIAGLLQAGLGCLVGRFARGLEHRALVLDGRVLALSRKHPPVCVGDGSSTVRELLERRSLARVVRAPTPLLAGLYPPEVALPIDAELARVLSRQGLALESVPAEGQEVRLRFAPSHDHGGRWLDAGADPAAAELSRIAVAAAAALGLRVAGVDLLLEEGGARVLSVNSRPTRRPYLLGETPRDVLTPLLEAVLGPVGFGTGQPGGALAASGAPYLPARFEEIAEHLRRAVGITPLLLEDGRRLELAKGGERIVAEAIPGLRRSVPMISTVKDPGVERFSFRGQRWHAPSAFGLMPDALLNPVDGVLASLDKATTQHLLEVAGVPVPRGRRCGSREALAALWREGALSPPLCAKPCYGYGGLNVTVGVTSEAELLAAGEPIFALKLDVLVQECFAGEEYRVYVLDGEVLFAARKRRPFVVGDGSASVAELLERFRATRAAIPAPEGHSVRVLEMYPPETVIALDDEIRRALALQGLEPSSVPAAGREVELRLTRNWHGGGVWCNETDQLSARGRRASIEAARAIGCQLAGVDLMVAPPRGEEAEVRVIEVNAYSTGNNANHWIDRPVEVYFAVFGALAALPPLPRAPAR